MFTPPSVCGVFVFLMFLFSPECLFCFCFFVFYWLMGKCKIYQAFVQIGYLVMQSLPFHKRSPLNVFHISSTRCDHVIGFCRILHSLSRHSPFLFLSLKHLFSCLTPIENLWKSIENLNVTAAFFFFFFPSSLPGSSLTQMNVCSF